jgi:ribosome biogenesis SPOUT family RNA methylase Rps3
VWPKHTIDHINGVRTDNRIGNLRDVTQQKNSENMRRPQKRTISGFLGVHVQRRKTVRYLAQIVTDGKLRHLGSYDTAEDAHAAYLEAKRRLHEGCTI